MYAFAQFKKKKAFLTLVMLTLQLPHKLCTYYFILVQTDDILLG